MEDYITLPKFQFVYGKGKSQFRKIYEQLSECAMKLFKYRCIMIYFKGDIVLVKRIQVLRYYI